MERICGNGEIGWMTLTVYGSSFLRVLLKKYGYELEDGLILVADNEKMSRRFITQYCAKMNGNGVYVEKAKDAKFIENFQAGFMIMQKGLKEENVDNFLFQKSFLPILMVGGILPESLKSDRYNFRLKEKDVDEIYDEKMISKIVEFTDYIIENVKEVCAVLEKNSSSIFLTEYKGNEKIIFSVLAGIGAIYAAYLRKKYPERYVVDFLVKYIDETKKRLQDISEFASGVELFEILSSLVWGNLYDNKDIFVADIEKINVAIYDALRENSAVLFDEKFYYFPPKLLINICQPLLETASEPELKRRLRDEGIIYCNSADYTVKKEIVNVYGAKERPRFILVKKEALLSLDNLMLEDVFAIKNEGEKERCIEVM